MKKVFFQKQFKSFFILLLIICSIIGMLFFLGNSHAISEKNYTRKEMQDMVVSTALSYYYNTAYSDYGQKLMDKFDPGENNSNYYSTGTFYWRNLNISPEQVNRGNYYRIDCSGFAFLTYHNTFGYDASFYNTLNTSNAFYKDNNNEYRIKWVSLLNNPITIGRINSKQLGEGWGNSQLIRMANKISGKECTSSTCNFLKGGYAEYNKLDNSQNHELVYYYYNDSYQEPKKIKDAYAKIKNNLQPGDIILIHRAKVKNSKMVTTGRTGHVMIYVGQNDKLKYEKNILHSTGTDTTYTENSKYNTLYKSNSIRNENADSYIDGDNGLIDKANVVDENNIPTQYMYAFAIYRPINTMCTNDTQCKISNNIYNTSLDEEQIKNNEARVELSDYRFEQFMTAHDIQVDNYTKNYNIVNENNSINVGDKLRYNLQVTNKSSSQTRMFNITAQVPDNTDYISCTENCNYNSDSKTISWNNVSITPEEQTKTYRFVVSPNKETKIINPGMRVQTETNTLQFSPLIISSGTTLNVEKKSELETEINKFKQAVNEGKIIYSNDKNEYKLDLDTITDKKYLSQSGYPKAIYYNAYNIDLGYVTNENIKNAVFNKLNYPKLTNDGNEYVGDKTENIYIKKTNSEIEKITNVDYKNINKMVVLYGGVKLKGNENNDRTKYLRSFNNYKLGLSSDLQIGDIILSFNSNTKYMKTHLVTDFDDATGPILSLFKPDGNLIIYNNQYKADYYKNVNGDSDAKKPSDQVLNELFNQDLFVVLRPSKIYGTTILYDYNYERKEKTSYIAYDIYKNLIDPERDESYEVKYICEETSCKDKDISRYIFKGWYKEPTYQTKITNTTKLISTKAHTIYAKWENERIILPEAKKEGYKFLGWYSDNTYKTKVGDVNDSYTPTKNTTLYAKFEQEEININSNILKIKENKIYLEEENSAITSYKELIEIENKETYKIEIYDEQDNKIEKGRVYTGSKTKILKNNIKVLEYINIVKGDVNRSGTVGVADVMKIAKYLIEKDSMQEVYDQEAADIDEDGKVRVNDIIKIAKYLIKEGELK